MLESSLSGSVRGVPSNGHPYCNRVVHGHQQLSLFNADYDERCFLPIHVYDTATSRPVAVLLRPGKTPSGNEIRCHLRRLVRRVRRHWAWPDSALVAIESGGDINVGGCL